MSAPIIVSAVLGAADFRWLDAQRRAHYPAERNQLGAHMTLFHHLPPSCEPELRRRLHEACTQGAPKARIAGLISLGRGVAYRIESPDLEEIRFELAEAFHGLLTPQDSAAWRPHVTIQNKVTPEAARGLLGQLSKEFAPRRLDISGLAAWYYRNGPWEWISGYGFGDGRAIGALAC